MNVGLCYHVLIQKIECNISKKLEFNNFYESAMLFSSLEVF